MKLVVLVALALVGFSQAATPTKEPNEFETLSFYYNRLTFNLILKEQGKMNVSCYVDSLSDTEKMQVHRDQGLKTLELKMLSNMGTASMVSLGMLAAEDAKWCQHGLHNRTITYYSV